MKTTSRNIVSGILLGIATLLGTASWTPLAAQAPIPDMIDQKDNAGWGTFVSFKNGALILKGRQQGVSTYIGARFYHRTTMDFGKSAFIDDQISR